MLSTMDDYPIHQISDTIRHVGTSDRNFYDRYYFNIHSSSDELFMIMGMGQYPALAVQDAFCVVRCGNKHHVVRASRQLGDRIDTSVGPFKIEVVEALKKVHFVLEDNEHNVKFDLTWEGAIPAFLEPRQYIRRHGRVIFDSMRFAQTGCWTGSLTLGDKTYDVTPDTWKGTRDRSWGIRPVGEDEPPGIHEGTPFLEGMWNYAPMQFDDFSILYICNEHNDGTRVLEEAVKIWNDPSREPEWLGRPEHEHVLSVRSIYTTVVESSTLRFPHAPGGPLEVRVEPLTHVWVMVGTGYGLEQDWKHGMYQGELKVEGLVLDMEEDKDRMLGVLDHVAKYTLTDSVGRETVGYGLFEYMFLGQFDKYDVK